MLVFSGAQVSDIIYSYVYGVKLQIFCAGIKLQCPVGTYME
jgi:hypothetical protein